MEASIRGAAICTLLLSGYQVASGGAGCDSVTCGSLCGEDYSQKKLDDLHSGESLKIRRRLESTLFKEYRISLL